MGERTSSPEKAIAVFDLDHTLTRNDTYVAFLIAALRARPFRLLRGPELVFALAVQKARLRDNTWLKSFFLRRICGGSDRKLIEKIATKVADDIVTHKIRPGALQALDAHRARGDRIVLATASLDIYAHAIAERLGISDVLATRAEWHGDRLTGHLASANLYGQAKADAVACWLQGMGARELDTAYSDHHSDLPLLRDAIRGFAVNPTPRLRAAADASGLDVVCWDTTEETNR